MHWAALRAVNGTVEPPRQKATFLLCLDRDKVLYFGTKWMYISMGMYVASHTFP